MSFWMRSCTHQLLGLILLLPMAVSSASELPADLGARLTQGYISPAMQRFEQSAHHMEAALKTWCATPEKAGTQVVHDGFTQLVDAWSGIEFLRFGPLVAANRYEKISFWPDPRGMVARQVQTLLGTPDAVPDAAALATHSVAVQGLPALEYVLYRDGGLLAAPVRVTPDNTGTPVEASAGAFAPACAYATAIAGNLANISSDLAGEWGQAGAYAQRFSQPSASNPLYRNQQEVAGEAIKALSTGLQFARDIKLLPVLGGNIKAIKPKRAPFWRSGLAAQSMAAAAQAILQFYQAGGYRYSSDAAWVDASLQAELLRIGDNFKSMQANAMQMEQASNHASDSWVQLVGTQAGYRQLTLATLLIKNAKSLVDEDVAPAFGVRIGFNALDGD